VAILLKTVTFVLWMIIMLAMLKGTKHGSTSNCHDVKIYIKDEEDVEVTIRKALRSLNREDRLIIHNVSRNNDLLQQVLIKSLTRKNPSIIYYHSADSFV
jgi:hypothetical protein